MYSLRGIYKILEEHSLQYLEYKINELADRGWVIDKFSASPKGYFAVMMRGEEIKIPNDIAEYQNKHLIETLNIPNRLKYALRRGGFREVQELIFFISRHGEDYPTMIRSVGKQSKELIDEELEKWKAANWYKEKQNEI